LFPKTKSNRLSITLSATPKVIGNPTVENTAAKNTIGARDFPPMHSIGTEIAEKIGVIIAFKS
jgi:hypothetical protein